MPPTLTIHENGDDFRPEITEEQGGFRAVRYGWIDTGDVTAALLGTIGMPQRGDAWDASTPNLILQRKTISLWNGQTSLARFEYATPGMNGGVLDYPAKIGKPISIAVPSLASATAKRFREKDSTPGAASPTFIPAADADPLIAQGQGVPVEAGIMDQRVKVAYAMTNLAAVPWSRIRDLFSANAINTDAVGLPNYFGSGYAYACAVGTLRYRFFEVELQADLFVISHVMAEAAGHYIEYEDLDEDGNVRLPNIRGHVYPKSPFAGLW